MTGKGLNKGQAQDLHDLQSYGMDPYYMLIKLNGDNNLERMFSHDTLSSADPDLERLQNMIFTGLGNFVDSKIVNPQAHNVPKYFNDPRLRVVTAMGRFMATAHATILPKLYKDYIVSGTVGMRYQAFSTIAGALILAQLVGMLKDQLSYGEDSPYIKGNRKKIQRVINSSGLLGQFEKVVDKAMPLYPATGPKLSENPVGWAGDKIADVSPVAAWAAKVPKGVMEIGEGKTSAGVNTLLRASPLVGSFPVVTKDIAALFK
jgi:hypothetical protein